MFKLFRNYKVENTIFKYKVSAYERRVANKEVLACADKALVVVLGT